MRHSPIAWWRRRSLHARLSLLVTGAVAAAVVTLAALAFGAVSQIQRHQIETQLDSDAQAIAADPSQWPTGDNPRPPDGGHGGGGGGGGHHDGPHDLGASWQILDDTGAVVGRSTDLLPVTAAARQVAAGGSAVREEVTVDGDRYLMLTVPATGGGAVQVAIDQDPALHTLNIFGLLLVVAAGLGIAGAALLGRTVARAGLVPVDRLTGAVEDVTATMDLGRPIDVTGDDEIARLGRSVNTLLAAIDTARQAQRALVEDAGHELRTPLTSIRTNIELLLAVERRPELAHRLPPEERTRLLQDLDAQVTELATLATELVELAREEATREATEPMDLAEVVTAAIERVRTRAPGLSFAVDLAPAAMTGRPAELERMVVNVLDNAAKWSPAGGTVGVRLAADDPGWHRLTVTDQGPGIDAADRPHVFDRFYRARAARGMPGSGLGLAIVAQTAARHGGTASTEPHQPHGTVVAIRLPTRPPAAHR